MTLRQKKIPLQLIRRLKLKGTLSFLGVTVLYCLFASRSIVQTKGYQLATELPLFLVSFVTLHLPIARSRGAWVAAGLPLWALYGIHDFALGHLDHVVGFGDLRGVPLLLQVAPVWAQVAAPIVLVGPAIWWATLVVRSRAWRRALWFSAWVMSLALVVLGLPMDASLWISQKLELSSFSEKHNVAKHGRLFMALLRQARQAGAVRALLHHRSIEETSGKVALEVTQRLHRNLHVIVLESFFDVRRLHALSLSRSPLPEELDRWLPPTSNVGLVPGFGGGTAAAEFELLCGVPALREYGTDEFNHFTGAQTYCLPSILGAAGYETLASHPYRASAYNRERAYPSLGFHTALFSERYVPKGTAALTHPPGDTGYLFDADLYAQNLARVEQLMKAGRPFFNHVLTMYGHIPYEDDDHIQPHVVLVTPPHERALVFANQAYYRGLALADYLDKLFALDGDALVVVAADHLPFLEGGQDEYGRLGLVGQSFEPSGEPSASAIHETFLLVIDRGPGRGHSLSLAPLHLWQVFHVILDLLSDGAHCAARGCRDGVVHESPESLRDTYDAILAASLRD